MKSKFFNNQTQAQHTSWTNESCHMSYTFILSPTYFFHNYWYLSGQLKGLVSLIMDLISPYVLVSPVENPHWSKRYVELVFGCWRIYFPPFMAVIMNKDFAFIVYNYMNPWTKYQIWFQLGSMLNIEKNASAWVGCFLVSCV